MRSALICAVAALLAVVPSIARADEPACGTTEDPLELALRKQTSRCNVHVTRSYGTVIDEISLRETKVSPQTLFALLDKNARAFGLAVPRSELRLVVHPGFDDFELVQGAPGRPDVEVSCGTDVLYGDRARIARDVELAGTTSLHVCLVSEVAQALQTHLLDAGAARTKALAHAKDLGDDAPKIERVWLTVRRRTASDPRGLAVWRLAAKDAYGARLLELDGATGALLQTFWTTGPEAEHLKDKR